MTTQTQETYERRIATLRRLGAVIRQLSCVSCGDTFVDPEPLGGRAWKVVITDNRGIPSMRRACCSESCAKKVFDKHRGPRSAWIEGYEPPEPGNR